MHYTVTGPAGTKDVEFESYARQLRRQGKNLGNLPRVPDPENPTRRWVCVFDSQAEAQQFADNLIAEQPGETDWHVVTSDAPPSHGPFSPVRFQMRWKGSGLLFRAFDMSLVVLREAYPDAPPSASEVFIDTETWTYFRTKQKTLDDLVEDIIPLLSGLELEQLASIGYAIIDAETHETLIHVPPGGITRLLARKVV